MIKFPKKGYVYILSNPAFSKNLFKIGRTTRTPEVRARELYETHSGVPGQFTVKFKHEVLNCEFAEEVIHNRLDDFRMNDYREFFELPLDAAKIIVKEVCGEIDRIYKNPTACPKKKSDHPTIESEKMIFLNGNPYVKYDTGIIYDIMEGLEWIAGPDRPITFNEAKSWISALQTVESKWSLPSISELEGLYKEKDALKNLLPIINRNFVSMSKFGDPDFVWYFDFSIGKMNNFIAEDNYNDLRVIAVRPRLSNYLHNTLED